MFRKLMLAVLLVAFAGVATAAESKPRGFYIGATTGLSVLDDDGAAQGTIDDQDTMIQIYAGYKIFKYLAVEARYADYGGFSDSFDTLEVTAASVHAVGIIPFGQSGWELFGQLGVGQVNLKLAGFADEEEDTFAGGVGVRYSFTDLFSMAVQTDVHVWDDPSGLYTFSVGGTALAFQLTF